MLAPLASSQGVAGRCRSPETREPKRQVLERELAHRRRSCRTQMAAAMQKGSMSVQLVRCCYMTRRLERAIVRHLRMVQPQQQVRPQLLRAIAVAPARDSERPLASPRQAAMQPRPRSHDRPMDPAGASGLSAGLRAQALTP